MIAKDQSLVGALFALNKLNSDCRIQPVQVDFQIANTIQSSPYNYIPSFNHDRSYFTPCFILPADQKYYHENNTFEKYQFEEKIQRSMQETMLVESSSLYYQGKIPTPNSNYCQICTQKFDDYFIHCAREDHLLKSTLASGTDMIRQLCLQLQQQQNTKMPARSSKKSLVQKKSQQQKLANKKKGAIKKQRGKVPSAISKRGKLQEKRRGGFSF